jgi:hypothetical protein
VVVIELGLISSNNSYFVSRCLVIRLWTCHIVIMFRL